MSMLERNSATGTSVCKQNLSILPYFYLVRISQVLVGVVVDGAEIVSVAKVSCRLRTLAHLLHFHFFQGWQLAIIRTYRPQR